MIRILHGRNARLVTIASVYTYSYDWSSGLRLCLIEGAEVSDKWRSGDLLEPDIFGEDIYLSFPPESKFHKWTSIRNYQAKGTLPMLDMSRWYSNDPERPDIVTGSYTPQYYVTWDDRSFGVERDNARYPQGRHPDVEHSWYAQFYKRTIYDYRMICSYSEVIYRFRGHSSFDRYSDKSWKKGTYSVDLFKREGTTLYRAGLSVEVLLTVSGSPRSWDSKISEAVDLWLARNYSALRWSYWSGWSLTPLSSSALNVPNYEALFPESDRNPNWSQLAAEAYSSLAFSDINGIAFIKDAGEMGQAFTSFAKTLRSIPSSRIKAAAAAWLSVHYGFKLALLDTMTLKQELQKQSLRNSRKSKCQSVTTFSRRNVQYTARYQVFYNEFDKLMETVDQLLRISDAVLTSENLWDMVPYSFVVDWFINVGDMLSAIDGWNSLIREHTVIAAGKSVKGVLAATPEMFGLPKSLRASFTGVNLTCYFRRYERYLQRPTFLPSLATINPFAHSVEGAALVITRL